MTDPEAPSSRRLVASIGCVVLVLLAIALEVASGQGANSPEVADFSPFVPLSWPQPVRALWWVLVATAAGGHRLLLDPGPGRRRWVLAGVAATPFLVFAGGVASGAQWSAWH